MKIFNPQGTDRINDRKIFGGNSTNIINLNNVKYAWATQLYRQMLEQFWIPEKIDLSGDVTDYNLLTDDERRAFIGILSYLIFLDSVQVTNLPNLMEEITAPEVKQCVAIQVMQEAVHSQSYQYMIETIIAPEDRDYIYDYWRTDEMLYARCEYIASLFQKYADSHGKQAYGIAMVGDYLLEGLYFYSGFQFFYTLSSRNLMQGTADIITYINRDELSHVRLFQKMLPDVLEYTGVTQDTVLEMMDYAAQQEIKWACHICDDKILGFSHNAITGYVKWLANSRLKAIGYPTLYDQTTNPLKHLDTIADLGKDASVKGNFFESTVTSYNMSSAVDGWSDF